MVRMVCSGYSILLYVYS